MCIVRNDWEIDCSLEEFKCDELHESEGMKRFCFQEMKQITIRNSFAEKCHCYLCCQKPVQNQ